MADFVATEYALFMDTVARNLDGRNKRIPVSIIKDTMANYASLVLCLSVRYDYVGAELQQNIAMTMVLHHPQVPLKRPPHRLHTP